MSQKKSSIVVFIGSSPYSSDPLEYDSFYHHIAFGSVFGNLVSQYKLGEHTPELAKSWNVSQDHKVWTFFLRNNLKFSDGSSLTTESFVYSWLRMAKIMKKRGSRSGFFENILGYNNLKDSSNEIEGLKFNEESITIQLIKPDPALLDKISFGLYSVVHPSQFDKTTGEWIADKKNLISSGAYVMKEWNDDHLVISLREDYPMELYHQNAIKNIEIFWKNGFRSVSEIDIAMGSELSLPPQPNFILQGGPPSSIFFMRIMSWQDPASIFFRKKIRIAFRNKFYNQLENKGYKVIRSFFPLIVKGVNELADPVVSLSEAEIYKKEISIPSYPTSSLSIPLNNLVIDSSIEVANSFELNLSRKPLALDTLFAEVQKKSKKTTWDLVRYGTGILASDPINDVKFMFRSNEGIVLPDESGDISKELDKIPVDLQKINQLLWDDGIIWPVTHYSSGLWARPDLDFSQINLVLPPTQFQWIGWK